MPKKQWTWVDVEKFKKKRRKEIAFDYEGETIMLIVDTRAPAQPGGPHPDAEIAWLRRVILKWNLAEKEGDEFEPLPVHEEVLRELPPNLYQRIVREVRKVLSPPQADEEA